MSWRRTSTREMYANRWISVREDEVVGPAGEGIYGVVTVRHPAVFVVAVDEHDRVCLVRLHRYPSGVDSVEVPAGGTDGDEPLAAAQRELREETGFEASAWIRIGFMYALNGIAHAPEHVYLARSVRPAADASASRAEEGIDTVTWVPFAEVMRMVSDGEITDGESVAALFYAALHLGRVTLS